MPVTSLRMPFAQPPEVAICSACATARLEAKAKSRSNSSAFLGFAPSKPPRTAFDLAVDLDLDLDLDLRDFRRPSEGHAEGGDGHGCPSSAEAPGTGPAARTPGSMPVARGPRSAAQGPDDGSAAFFGYFLSRLTKSDSP